MDSSSSSSSSSSIIHNCIMVDLASFHGQVCGGLEALWLIWKVRTLLVNKVLILQCPSKTFHHADHPIFIISSTSLIKSLLEHPSTSSHIQPYQQRFHSHHRAIYEFQQQSPHLLQGYHKLRLVIFFFKNSASKGFPPRLVPTTVLDSHTTHLDMQCVARI